MNTIQELAIDIAVGSNNLALSKEIKKLKISDEEGFDSVIKKIYKITDKDFARRIVIERYRHEPDYDKYQKKYNKYFS